MKINVSEDRTIELRHIYDPIVLKSDHNDEIYICMRDGGFEINIKSKPVHKLISIRNGEIKQLNITSTNLEKGDL